jgi:hypothetical protein
MTPPHKKYKNFLKPKKHKNEPPGKKTKKIVKQNVRIYISTEKMTQTNVQIWL